MKDAPTICAGAVYTCTQVSHLCMHKWVEAHMHMRCPSVAMADDHVLNRGGHDGDGDEVEYNDKDEEPCTQGEGGDMFV